VTYGGDQEIEVALVETSNGVVQVDGDASGKAGRQFEDPPFDLLTELLDVFAVQAGCPSRRPIAEMSTMPESPGCFDLAASRVGTETGHTRLNRSASFSSLPVFDVSRSWPWALLQCP